MYKSIIQSINHIELFKQLENYDTCTFICDTCMSIIQSNRPSDEISKGFYKQAFKTHCLISHLVMKINKFFRATERNIFYHC